jgi:phytoene dehydrogenase-like protein
MLALQSAKGLAENTFKGPKARAFFAGLAAHSIMPIENTMTAAFALILGTLGHAVGWPMPRGGSQNIANALAGYFLSLGGKIYTDTSIETLEDLPSATITLCDITPRQLLKIADHHLPATYRKKLERYRYGPGVFKIDWALSSPIPWKSKECLQAGTVHIAGTLEEIQLSESEIWAGRTPQRPYTLIAQQSLFDNTRAPTGKHTGWAYCHVPNGSQVDMTERIEAQIERFAPGFRDCILAKNCRGPLEMEAYNANYIGGDINGGVQDIYQLFTRPVLFPSPYTTPIKGLYLCSSSTPPGGGVHGMCGYHAACTALRSL